MTWCNPRAYPPISIQLFRVVAHRLATIAMPHPVDAILNCVYLTLGRGFVPDGVYSLRPATKPEITASIVSWRGVICLTSSTLIAKAPACGALLARAAALRASALRARPWLSPEDALATGVDRRGDNRDKEWPAATR